MNRTAQFLALTISPPQRSMTAKYLFRDDSILIQRLLNLVSQHYIVVPEFDDTSRLHYHGVLRMDDWVKWHKSVCKRLGKELGFIKIKPINNNKDHIGWLCYVYKHWHISKAVLKLEYPIMYGKARRKRAPIEKEGVRMKHILEYF